VSERDLVRAVLDRHGISVDDADLPRLVDAQAMVQARAEMVAGITPSPSRRDGAGSRKFAHDPGDDADDGLAWRTGFVDSAGESIYWECAGAGDPLVICHGAGSSHVSFYQQLPQLASDELQVLLWDQRGYGNSTRRGPGSGIADSVADLSAVLAGAGLGSERIHLVGQAMGGLVAAAWAIANPGRVRTLALWDGPFAADADGRELSWQLRPDDQGVASTLIDRRVSGTRAVGAAFRQRDPVGAYLYQTIQLLGLDRPPYTEVFETARSAPVSIAALAALDVPILFGWGEHDHVVDAEALRRLADLIPGATTVTIRDSGHSPYFERPVEWNQAVQAHAWARRQSLIRTDQEWT
jgi:pimeloyl-ACP methyl ester carboxylesterase